MELLIEQKLYDIIKEATIDEPDDYLVKNIDFYWKSDEWEDDVDYPAVIVSCQSAEVEDKAIGEEYNIYRAYVIIMVTGDSNDEMKIWRNKTYRRINKALKTKNNHRLGNLKDEEYNESVYQVDIVGVDLSSQGAQSKFYGVASLELDIKTNVSCPM
jgi:hypothetical protein